VRRLIALLSGVAAFVLFAAAIDWMYRPDPATIVRFATCPAAPGELTASAAGAVIEASDTVPFYRRLKSPETVRLCGEFEGQPELLILPRLAGNAFEVRIDGERRFSRGAPERPASFWIQPQLVALDGLEPGPHRAEIEIYGLYDLGVRIPPYLATWKGGGLRAGALEWLSSDLVSIAAGLNLGVGILLLAYGFQRRRQRTEAILFGIAAFAAVLYVPDYIPSDGLLGADLFLLRRKLSLAGSFLFGSSLTYGLELSTRARYRIGPIALGVTALLAVAALAAPGQIELKLLSTVGAVLFLPLSAYATYLAARFLEPHFAWLWVFFGASTIQLTFSLATGTGHLFLFHYGMLAAALGGGVRMTSQLASIARELGRATNAALTDPLTGARNRAFCDTLTLAVGDIVAMVDFDDFKRVNDQFGHERGDRLLVEFVRAARLRLRGTDHVVRMGGDEFALVIKGASLAAARRVVEEVFATWRESSPDLEPRASYGLIEARAEPLDRILAEADRAMYDAKVRSRGRRELEEEAAS
jgi:diguanylate cyclase (GGDEF)-like protein